MPTADPPPRIRAGTPGDVDALAALAARTMRESYGADHDPAQVERHIRDNVSRAHLAAELSDPAVRTLLAFQEDVAVGYATLKAGETPECVAASAPVELSRIYVLRDRIGRGTGSSLIRAALDECRAATHDVMWLSVWDRNERARRFYRRWGFREVGGMTFLFGGAAYEDLVLARSVDRRDDEPGNRGSASLHPG